MTPQRVRVRLRAARDRSYDIVIGADLAAAGREISRDWPGAKKFIVTDSNVETLYGRSLAWSFRQRGEQVGLLAFPAGEANKNRATRDMLEDAMLRQGANRDSLVIALGGGVVGDVAGFTASTLLRGVPYVQIPTTLLAQVDSSVGGKVAIDHPSGKNLLGAFHQPRRVYVDLGTLGTLPERDYRSGFAEVIKIAAVKDRALFAFLEENAGKLLRRERASLAFVVRRSCALKAAVVEADEREAGPRRLLNFGHTIGHALETHSRYGLLHGEAVAIGMAAEAALSARLGLSSARDAARLNALLERFGLPTAFPKDVSLAAIAALTARDKKAKGDAVLYTLLRRIGAGRHGIPITVTTLRTHWPL